MFLVAVRRRLYELDSAGEEYNEVGVGVV